MRRRRGTLRAYPGEAHSERYEPSHRTGPPFPTTVTWPNTIRTAPACLLPAHQTGNRQGVDFLKPAPRWLPANGARPSKRPRLGHGRAVRRLLHCRCGPLPDRPRGNRQGPHHSRVLGTRSQHPEVGRIAARATAAGRIPSGGSSRPPRKYAGHLRPDRTSARSQAPRPRVRTPGRG
jgi:hypothetical protein